MKRDWTSRSTLVLTAVVLVLANVVSVRLFGRLDLTDDRVYSLSEASVEAVTDLEDPVTVTAYFTDDLPAPWGSNRRFLQDKLDDYRAYGGSDFQYRFVDPGDDDERRAEAERMGIPPVQVQVIESDNVQLRNAWMGVVVETGGEREVLPVVQDLSTLEYDLTSAIRRLTRVSVPSVGFLSGHGESDPDRDMPTLREALGRNYDVHTVTADSSGLSRRPDALLVVAPRDSLGPGALRAIDAYVREGGRVAFLLDAVMADLQSGRAEAMDVGLDTLLRAWGMGLSTDLVMDRQSSAVTVQSQQGFFQVSRRIEYPFFPIATRFHPENRMVHRLQQLLFYYVSSVDTTIAVPAGVEREILAESSDQAGRQQGFFFVQPMEELFPLEEGPFPLAVAGSGSFPSVFAGGVGEPSRIVLVGDGDLLNERLLGVIPGNIEFGLNLVDWLVQEEALLSIRTKSVEPRFLDPVPDEAKPWIRWFILVAPVLLVIGVGLVRWRARSPRAGR